MEIGIRILIIFLLILLSGFFSMSEAAIFAARKSRLQHRANEGDNRARRALDLSGTPNRFLPTVTIGITSPDFWNKAYDANGNLIGYSPVWTNH